ncbi:MAG: hypothetical protein IH620_03375 [Ignavibacterium sp.]|nr:hypothetical protein [Ignavibacterium sp.]
MTNLIGGSVESSIKTTFNSAPMGFPDNIAQINVQYNPGTVVNLWRGVYYNISTSHASYEKNGVNYNFRNWNNYLNYQSPTILRIESNTSEIKSMYYQTQPLSVLNNLEGGSTNNNFNIIWQTPEPDLISSYQYGTPYNAFYYQIPLYDNYSVEAPLSFQNLNTTWWFYKWNDGTASNLKQNIQVTSPTNLTAYYKGHLRSNSTTGISSNSQRKMVRTDNGIYHLVYESMGNVYYTHSLTSNFNEEWAEDQYILDHAKNPAIEYDGNIVKAVCEYYDPAFSTNVDLWLLTFEQQPNGIYENTDSEIFATCTSSYFGSAKPVISYNPAGVALVYRKNSTEGLKVKTEWHLDLAG